MYEQIIYLQSQVFHLPFIFMKSNDFKFFAKMIWGNYVFCCSSHIIALTLQATLKIVLIKIVAILMMLAKLASLSLLKIKVF